MSWESVVDGDDAPSDAGADAAIDDATPSSPTSPPASTPLTGPESFSFSITPTSDAEPMPAISFGSSPEPSEPIETPIEAPVVEPISFAPLTLSPDPTPEPPPVVRFKPMAPIVPALADDAPAPVAAPAVPVETPEPAVIAEPVVAPEPAPVAAEPVVAPVAVAAAPVSAPPPAPAPAPAPEAVAAPAPPADVPSSELPQIVEATPMPDDVALGGLEIDGAPVTSGPRLPRVQQQARSSAPVAYETPVEYAPMNQPAPQRRHKSGGGFKLVLTLIVLGGLVAAGIVFGRPYLFPPTGWDPATQPYAEAVETVRGVEFVEPISVIAEPTTAYTSRLGAQLVGDWTDDESTWRALGLLNGAATEQKVTELLADWQDALYSRVDGQVYRDAAVTGPQIDAQITEAMTAASLDQEFRWSADQPARTLDDQVLTLAEVQRQSAAALAETPFAVTLDQLQPGVLAFVPPIVGYRAFAPAAYAEFDNAPSGELNALARIGAAGPGPLATEVLVAAPDPTMTGADSLVASPRPQDRSFWYLVFGGFLESRTAYTASESVVESSLSIADRAGTACVYATFSGGDVAQTGTLRAALESWSAAAPVEFASTFSVLADGTLQLVSCDPGAGFEIGNRLGVARELVGWRMAELATIEAVRQTNGTEADITAAWATIEASNVGVELAALPGDMSPAASAKAARSAVAAALTPAG